MTKNNKGKKEKEYLTVYTPLGRLSYPYLVKPDTGRKESSNKYSAEIYVPKAVWMKEGKPVVDAILKVAREYFKDPKLALADFKSPLTDMDKERDVKDYQKGTIRIRAKASSLFTPSDPTDRKPIVIGPQKNPDSNKFDPWTDEQVTKIKGGDYVRLICSPYGYSQQGGGVAFGLNFVQFGKEGPALGEGKMKSIEALGEIEVEVDSPDEMVDTEEDDDVDVIEPVKPAKKGGRKKVVEVEAEDESDDEDPMLNFG